MSLPDRLTALLGEEAVLTDESELAARSRDLSPSALIDERAGTRGDNPDVVVRPPDASGVADLLRWADAEKVPVVPFGGGSSVVRGIVPAGCIVLDMGAMASVVDVDEKSRLVRVQAGVRGNDLQSALATDGWMLGHQPQSIALSTVGGWIATRSAGQLSLGFGVIEDIVASMDVVLPGGRVLAGRPIPRRSAGPRLEQLFIGSEGSLGVITEAVLRMVPVLIERADVAFTFEHMADGVAACRSIVQSGPGPLLLRLYDQEDTAIFWRRAEDPPTGNVLIMSARTEDELDRAAALAQAGGGTIISETVVDLWWQHRNDAAEDMIHLLAGHGPLGPHAAVDTFEVVATWSKLRGVYHSMKERLQNAADIAGCHISHVYPDGACLYFTAASVCEDDAQAAERVAGWWDLAMRSALREGASISHHHGIGRTRAAWLREELGDWHQLLALLKAAVDPNRIMNPGVLGL